MRLARGADYNILMDPWLGISFPSATRRPCAIICLFLVLEMPS